MIFPPVAKALVAQNERILKANESLILIGMTGQWKENELRDITHEIADATGQIARIMLDASKGIAPNK